MGIYGKKGKVVDFGYLSLDVLTGTPHTSFASNSHADYSPAPWPSHSVPSQGASILEYILGTCTPLGFLQSQHNRSLQPCVSF